MNISKLRKTNVVLVMLSLFLTMGNCGKANGQLQLDSGGKTEAVKNFPINFSELIKQRGTPLVYNKQNSQDFEYIGMPVGGIGAGLLYLGGDGALWFWDIFNTNKQIRDIKGETAYQYPYKRSEAGKYGTHDVNQGFALKVVSSPAKVIKSLDRSDIDSIEFLGQYPVGQVKYFDPELPVEVEMKAFSPFVPLELDKSSYPATIFLFTVKNNSETAQTIELGGWLENASCIETRVNGGGFFKNTVFKSDNGNLSLALTSVPVPEFRGALEKRSDFGSMTLTLINSDENSRGNAYLKRTKTDYEDLQGVFSESDHENRVQVEFNAPAPVGSLVQQVMLQPGEKKNIEFLLTWYFPNSQVAINEGSQKSYYGAQFDNASDVADNIIDNYSELVSQTLLWRDTWYNSTLPFWFLDRTFLNTSILASNTSYIFEDGRFYGFEGGYQGPGTCTHVWGYVQAMGRLFPQLEKSLREKMDFVPYPEGAMHAETGVIEFRGKSHGLAVDGQSGIILRALLSHQMSADNSFLEKNYENIKKAMKGLTEARDADHDGILTGPQHNTLDADWYGKVTWLSLYYTAALRAMAVMANEVGDYEYEKFCLLTADKGRKYIEENLFNGEYFIHEADPDHPESPGTYTGCEYSQLMGQSWAYQVGLGAILDPEKVSAALKSLWRYNFTTDVGPFRNKYQPGRWYAMPGEGGLIACTWPQGGTEVLEKGKARFAAYNNECQNGYEYACTSAMMWHGMHENALAHIWYMHNDRYHGSKRNPWCEIEWGLHYSRSMASYGHFIAACGFKYHGPQGYIAFGPQFQKENFKAPFVTAEGWGTFQQTINRKGLNASIEVTFGKLVLNTIELEFDGKIRDVIINGIPAKFEQNVAGVTIHLEREHTVHEGEMIEVVIM